MNQQIITDYIVNRKNTKTRFEIDSALLQMGHKPDEIEKAWGYVNSTIALKYRPLFLSLEFWAIIWAVVMSVLIVITFDKSVIILPLESLTFWLIVASFAIFGFLIAKAWGKYQQRKQAFNVVRRKGRDFFLYTVIVIFGLFVALFSLVALGQSLVYEAFGKRQEVLTATIENHEYKLYTTGRNIDSDNYDYQLYRCEGFNLVCSTRDKASVTNLNFRTMMPDAKARFALVPQPDTKNIQLVYDGTVFYTFKNVR